MRFLVCVLTFLILLSGNGFSQTTVERINFETTILGSRYNPNIGVLKFIEHPSEFVLSTGEVVNHVGVGYNVQRARRLLSVSESDGKIIYEFDPEFGEEIMVYGIDLWSTAPDELSTSARFDETAPIQLIAEPGSAVATVSGQLTVTEYDRQGNFDPIFEPIPLAVPFESVVPSYIELTIENSTWQLDTFDQSFAFELVGHIDLAAADVLLGDVNQDGVVDFFDIQPFIDVLSSSNFQVEADIDLDLVVNFSDIQPFIAILSGGAP